MRQVEESQKEGINQLDAAVRPPKSQVLRRVCCRPRLVERISLYVLPTGLGQLSRCRTQHAIHAPYGSPYAVPTHIFSRAAVPLGGAARDGIVGLTIIGASVEIRVLPP